MSLDVESAITLTAESAIILGEWDLAFENVITLVFESAITLTAESAIILGESIFWEWRSFFVMMRGDHFGRVNFVGIAIPL